jgi:hypothetical protein
VGGRDERIFRSHGATGTNAQKICEKKNHRIAEKLSCREHYKFVMLGDATTISLAKEAVSGGPNSRII